MIENMAIVNRDLDVSEQMKPFGAVLSTSVGASAASSFQVAQMPYPGILKGLAVAAASISGAPVVSLSVKRWSAGGVRTIPYVGSTLAVLAIGASAPYQMIPLGANGSTLLSLQAGDVITVVQEFSGGNVAIGNGVFTAVVQPVQDIVKFFNITP